VFEAVKKQSLSDEVFDQLRKRIVSNSIQAGDELPSERVLCELLQVNRGAVREAIKRLQQAGLVQVRHGGATTVLDYRAAAGLELLPSLLINEAGEIQVDTARSIIRMRQILSPEIARDAAQQANENLVTQLQTLLDRMRTRQDTAQRQFAVFEFWELLVEGSGNIAYRLALNSLRKTYSHIWGLLTEMLADDFHDLSAFEQITAAVAQRNGEQAFAAARTHIDHSSELMNGFLDLYRQSIEQVKADES
tara:strand:- start:1464 stop:2210 length:747 start_codon:yes stop_codon:yes gene_type:complete